MDSDVLIPLFFWPPGRKFPHRDKALAENPRNPERNLSLGGKSRRILPAMDLTAIIYRLFAWLRPLLWYYHRLGYFLRVAIRCFEDDDCVLRMVDNPDIRLRVEGMLVDAERWLDIAIGLRTRELLGLPMPPDRPRRGEDARPHTPPTLERLAARLDRLVDRYNDIERLAQLRADSIRREMDAAPVLLGADLIWNRDDDDSGMRNPMIPTTTISSCNAVNAIARSRATAIRAPP